jgi:hypothetical protein
MRRRFAVSLGFIVTALIAPIAEAMPRVRVDCGVDEGGSRCVFMNRGTEGGQACTIVHLTNEVTGRSIHSEEVCSGPLQPGSSTTLPITFPGEQPRAICLSEHPASTWSSCATTTTVDDSPPLNLWAPLIALALLGSLAVFIDARRLGARRDLGPGLLRFPAITWAAGCLVGLFIPLIWYRRLRPMIKATAEYLPGGPTPPPYVAMMAAETAEKGARERARSPAMKR